VAAKADEGNGIVRASTNGLPRPSFLRVIVALAATVVVGLRLAAPILNPILFAALLALLFGQLYSWLRRRRLPTLLALVIMLVFVGAIFLGLFFTLGASIGRFTERLGFYASSQYRLPKRHRSIPKHGPYYRVPILLA
jgi:predicted PurR-regulated permease PerM